MLLMSLINQTKLSIAGKEKKSDSRRRSESVHRHRSESVTRNGRSAGDQVKVSLLGKVRTFYKASKEPPVQYLPPEKRLKLAWVYPLCDYRGEARWDVRWLGRPCQIK